jgi:hypothetical protein
VIRLDALKASTLHREYPTSDLALMPELSLYGKFVEVSEPLFYRRIEPDARYRASTASAHQHYFPNDKFGSGPAWQLLRHKIRGVSSAPVTWSQRVRVYDYLARREWWRRRHLLHLWVSRKLRSGESPGRL